VNSDRPGRAFIRVLQGAWRTPAPLLEERDAADLRLAAPLLGTSAAAGLAWARLADSPLAAEETAVACQTAYRWNAVRAALAEGHLRSLVTHLQGRGIEPLLVKGWALTRLYRDPGRRAVGDLDLYVPPEQLTAALAVRALPEFRDVDVDLKSEHSFPFDRPLADLQEAGVTLEGPGFAVRAPCAEDHLRLVCLHALGHGVWRGVWLCDAAVLVETRPGDFDWDRFLAGDPSLTAWCRLFLALAGELLGADLDGTPIAEPPPRWAVEALLRQWERGLGPSAHDTAAGALRSFRDPRALLRALRGHTRNEFQAMLELGVGPNAGPRPLLQAAAALRRAPRLFVRRRG
jgi:hypothetical protein